MIKIFFLLIFLSLTVLANSDIEKVRNEIERQSRNAASPLMNKVNDLISINKLPSTTFLVLAGPDLLQVGNQQSFHECTDRGCFYYERNFFRQISDIRWRATSVGTNLKVWIIGIYAHINRVWSSNEDGELLSLESEKINIDVVALL